MKKINSDLSFAPSSFRSFIIQSVSFQDYPSLRRLALKYPLLNLPAESALLKKKIETSENSFAGILPREKRQFLFVIKKQGEDGEVIGSSQISSKFGTVESPFYSLKIFKPDGLGKEKTLKASDMGSGLTRTGKFQSQEDKERQASFLQLKVVKDGPSYLGGLIVDEKYRGHSEKVGKQISLIRFLFAAMHPEFFEKTLHAEVAPVLDEKGKNAFFEHFVYPRTSLSMEEIDYLTLTNKEKLFSSYPREKILFSSLPESVQKCLGKPGLFSQRAAGLLKRQNFYFIGEVDPFDGGPYMQGKIKNIPLVQNTKKVFFSSKGFIYLDSDSPLFSEENKKWLWAKMEKGGFRGGVLEADVWEKANRLGLRKGDELFVTPFE